MSNSLGGDVTLSQLPVMGQENTKSNYKAQIDDAPLYHNHIHLMETNGTILPMEQKSGGTEYSIPRFVLSDTNNNKSLQWVFTLECGMHHKLEY